VEVEAPQPIFDLVNFDFLLKFTLTNFEKKKNVIKIFFLTGIQDFQDLLDHWTIFH
jgi:hypothetical protein